MGGWVGGLTLLLFFFLIFPGCIDGRVGGWDVPFGEAKGNRDDLGKVGGDFAGAAESHAFKSSKDGFAELVLLVVLFLLL